LANYRWRFEFTLNGIRYTSAIYKTRAEARKAEAKRREEIENQEIQTDMGFLDLINMRLDHVKAYNSPIHYEHYYYMARRWIKKWGKLFCKQITQKMVQKHVLERSQTSAYAANKDIRYLRAAFNFGKKRGFIDVNPVDGIEFLPVEKKIKYIPPEEDIDKVISVAIPEIQDYLWTIRETMARACEINRLTWDDVNLEQRYVILYKRKKRGSHLTPRKVPMTNKLYEILSRRFSFRHETLPWVFVNIYKDSKTGEIKKGPYNNYRKGIMKTLCIKAGVRDFRFHALRHAGASLMENSNVPIGAIQRILGHENRSTTEIYLHSLDGMERKAIAIYEEVREKSRINSRIDKRKRLTLIVNRSATH
jgi:integrase